MGDIAEDLRAALQAHLDGPPTRSLNSVANGIGVDVASLHRWLAGKRSLTLETAAKVATGLGLALRPDTEIKRRPKKRQTKPKQ